MKYFRIILIIFLILPVFSSNSTIFFLMAEDDSCDPRPPAKEGDQAPGDDHADDNYSVGDGFLFSYLLAPGSVILKTGRYREAQLLLGGVKFLDECSAEKLLKITPVLIIPSGGLNRREHDKTLQMKSAEKKCLLHVGRIYRIIEP